MGPAQPRPGDRWISRVPRRHVARRIQRIGIGVGGAIALALITLGLSRLKPAPPSVERATVWIDTVKRGEMLRQVRGVGTLVPEEIRWIPAATDGRVDRIVLQPGTPVSPDSVVLELSNPELTLAVEDAESQAKVARAQLTELRVRLAGQRLDQQAVLARAESQHNQARLKAEASENLAREGLVAAIDLKIATDNAREAAEQLRIERERQASMKEAVEAQLAAKALEVEQRQGLARLKRSQLDGLRVRAGLDGRPADRPGRGGPAGRSGDEPGTRRRPRAPQGGRQDPRDAGQGRPARAEGDSSTRATGRSRATSPASIRPREKGRWPSTSRSTARCPRVHGRT